MGINVSASYPVIISDIEEKSYTIQFSNTVMRRLATPVGKGQKGSSIQWPFWDPTGASASAGTEGTAITASASAVNASVYFTSAEKVFRTLHTYNDIEDATEDIVNKIAQFHGVAHAKAMETDLLALFPNFTPKVTASSATGFKMGTVAKARALLDAKTGEVPKPYNLVVHPYSWLIFFNNMTDNVNYGVKGSTGDEILDKFYVTTLLGDVRGFQSNHFTITGTTNDCTAGMFASDAIGLWTPRDYKLESDKIINRRAYELVSSQRYGAKVLLPNFGVEIVLDAGTPS